jgi:patatin-like phospholipase/acyl hydrolase
MDAFLEKKLGNATFLDTTISFARAFYSLDRDGPRLWSTYSALNNPNTNYFLKEAAGATSATPTYFPPKITETPGGQTYHDVDGGIFASSPTLIGMAALARAHPEIDT